MENFVKKTFSKYFYFSGFLFWFLERIEAVSFMTRAESGRDLRGEQGCVHCTLFYPIDNWHCSGTKVLRDDPMISHRLKWLGQISGYLE
jgi:hypothetical protein